ncbi:MAG: extracellular solute-binding protein [Bacteroidales bacterium]|nr:extracellular solute-binding protein [Lachnoclostridium sp.]MCM1382929.1 extracellular solute-binding protein [Lachnoclostridium sp.]MCM1465935.1 extracellular solute-binding protein [Bacteroidales bacterium]
MKSFQSVCKIAWRIYHTNKKRNAAIIAAVSMTIIFLMSVFTTMDSMALMLRQQNFKNFGTVAEGQYFGVTEEQYEKLRAQSAFTDISYKAHIGYVSEDAGIRTQISYAQPLVCEWCFNGLLQGKWAVKKDEIVVDEIYASHRELEVGDIIELDVKINENTLTNEFLVTGICQGNQALGVSNLYVSEDFLRNVGMGVMTVYCRFPYTEASDNLLLSAWEKAVPDADCDTMSNPVYGMDKNGSSNSYMTFLLLFASFLAVYLTIYTLYYISVVRDVKLFGQMKLLGVTKGQCSLILGLQALRQYVTALLFGTVFGLGICGVLVPLALQNYFKGVDGICVFRPEHILYAALAALAAVLMGIRKPIKILEKVGPVHADVFSGAVKVKKERKPVKMSVLRMAKRNIGRNGRRTFLAAASVCVMVLLFTCLVNLVETATASYMLYRKQPADFLIGTREYCDSLLGLSEERTGHSPLGMSGDIWEMDERVADSLKEQCGDASIQTYYYTYGISINEEQEITRRVEALLQNGEMPEGDNALGKAYYERQIAEREKANHKPFWTEMRYYVDFEALEECKALEGTLDREKFESGDYVVMVSNLTFPDNGTVYHAGERLKLDSFPDGVKYVKQDNAYTDIQGAVTKEYEVMAVVDEVPLMCAFLDATLVTFLPSANIPKADGMYRLCAVAVNTPDVSGTEPVVEQIVSRAGSDMYYLSYEVIKKEASEMLNLIYLFGGGLAAVTAVMAGISFFNHVMMGLIERKEEFVVLRIIGMTRRQLAAMLKWENLLVVTGSALTGFFAGTAGCYLVFNALGSGDMADSAMFQICKLNPIPAVLFILVLTALACLYPKVKKKSAGYSLVTVSLLCICLVLTGCGKNSDTKSDKTDARYTYRFEHCAVENMEGHAFGFFHEENRLYAGLISVSSDILDNGITCYDTDTGEAEKIAPEIPGDAMVSTVAKGEGNTFWAGVYETDERGIISSFAVNQYDEKGKLLAGNDISGMIAEEMVNSGTAYPSCVTMDAEGNLYFSFSPVYSAKISSIVEGISPQGKRLFRTEIAGAVQEMALSEDGKLFAAARSMEDAGGDSGTDGGNRIGSTELFEIDPSDGKSKSLVKKLPPNTYQTVLTVGMDGDKLYYNADGDFYEYSSESGESIKMFSLSELAFSEEELVGMVQADKSIFYVLVNTKDENQKACAQWVCARKVRLSDEEPVADKKVLTLALFSDDSHIRSVVNSFNRQSSDYRIEILVYGSTEQEDGQNRLQTDIAAGKTPDLIDLAGVDAASYIRQGIVADLSPFLAKSTEFSGEDFLANAVAAYEDGEALYAIPTHFWLSSMVGKSSVLGQRKGWTLSEYQDFVDSLADEKVVTAGISKEEMFNRIILQYAERYIDWEAGNCSFDSEEFLALLAFADRFSSNAHSLGMEERIEKLRSEELLLYPTVMNSTMSYLQNHALFDEDITYIGFPSESGSGTKIMVFGNAFGISEKCENKDAAWEFLKLLYTSEENIMDGFPVYKASLEKAFEAASVEWYHMDENGVRIEDPMAAIPYESMTLEIYSATEEEIGQLRTLIENAEPADLRTPGIYEILQEEAAFFFNGQKTAKEAAEVIQNRVSLYVREQG